MIFEVGDPNFEKGSGILHMVGLPTSSNSLTAHQKASSIVPFESGRAPKSHIEESFPLVPNFGVQVEHMPIMKNLGFRNASKNEEITVRKNSTGMESPRMWHHAGLGLWHPLPLT